MKDRMQLWFNDLSSEVASDICENFYGHRNWGNLTDEQIMTMYKFNTNSPIGSHHWFQTLNGRALRNGEFINNRPTHANVQMYGLQIQEILTFIGNNFDKINNYV